MRIAITPSSAQGSALAASIIVPLVSPGFRLGVATGSTPEGLYAQLRQAHAAGEFTLAGSRAWALDEYIGIDQDHLQRYRNVLKRELVGEDKTGLADADLHTPDGLSADPEESAKLYEESIAPGLDLQILGLGADGHIGFNEPSGSLSAPTNVVTLAPQTRRDNARFFDGVEADVPKRAITQGLATIMTAKKIVLLAFGEQKAQAIQGVVEGPVSAFCPASILQYHQDVTVIVDDAAAGALKLADYYRETWDSAQV
ncbi:glucosamine-6-phosphate deaminase [Gleimia hominis]|uniref:glucosamine-6-phosphate deaminase n=1 Tax=Gleimia hominis TaxID=595468 RepID=UPI000C7F8E8F|nr:glucosamine-6-phosphate deaminase [Gleimia hominis]WIK64912.1 glucosamine-6-phosphate deaminase [Gleimia hominis]